MSFEIQHQAAMLADGVRLTAFRRAIEKNVREDDCVADVGTGTGILASYAAARTRGTVYGIEYFPETAAIAEEMARQSGLTNLQVVRGASYGRPIDAAPR